MDGNFEWQKFQTNERIKGRLRDAEAHRRSMSARNSLGARVLPGALFLIGVGLFVAVIVWTGLGG